MFNRFHSHAESPEWKEMSSRALSLQPFDFSKVDQEPDHSQPIPEGPGSGFARLRLVPFTTTQHVHHGNCHQCLSLQHEPSTCTRCVSTGFDRSVLRDPSGHISSVASSTVQDMMLLSAGAQVTHVVSGYVGDPQAGLQDGALQMLQGTWTSLQYTLPDRLSDRFNSRTCDHSAACNKHLIQASKRNTTFEPSYSSQVEGGAFQEGCELLIHTAPTQERSYGLPTCGARDFVKRFASTNGSLLAADQVDTILHNMPMYELCPLAKECNLSVDTGATLTGKERREWLKTVFKMTDQRVKILSGVPGEGFDSYMVQDTDKELSMLVYFSLPF